MKRIYETLRTAEIWLAALVLAAVIGLVSWATATRVLGVPNIWVIEVTQVLFAWACLLASSIAFRQSTHFSVDLLSGMLPAHLRPPLRIAQNLIILVLVAGLGWVALDFVAQANRRPLPLTGIRFSWVAATIPAACALMALTCIENIVDTLRGDLPEPEVL